MKINCFTNIAMSAINIGIEEREEPLIYLFRSFFYMSVNVQFNLLEHLQFFIGTINIMQNEK